MLKPTVAHSTAHGAFSSVEAPSGIGEKPKLQLKNNSAPINPDAADSLYSEELQHESESSWPAWVAAYADLKGPKNPSSVSRRTKKKQDSVSSTGLDLTVSGSQKQGHSPMEKVQSPSGSRDLGSSGLVPFAVEINAGGKGKNKDTEAADSSEVVETDIGLRALCVRDKCPLSASDLDNIEQIQAIITGSQNLRNLVKGTVHDTEVISHIDDVLRWLEEDVSSIKLSKYDKTRNLYLWRRIPREKPLNFTEFMHLSHTIRASCNLIQKLYEQSTKASEQAEKDAIGFTAYVLENQKGKSWDDKDHENLLFCITTMEPDCRKTALDSFSVVNRTLAARLEAVKLMDRGKSSWRQPTGKTGGKF